MTAAEDPPPWAGQPTPPGYGGPPGPPPGAGPPPGYGWPPGYGSPPGYGALPPGYGQSQETESKAIVALILAIVSFTVFPLVPAIISVVLAGQSDREIAASGGRYGGTGFNLAARIISWINIGLCALGLVIIAVLIAAFANDSNY